MIEFRRFIGSDSDEGLRLLSIDIDRAENEILKASQGLWKLLVDGKRKKDMSLISQEISLNEFQEYSKRYLMRSFSPLKFSYICFRMILRRDLSARRLARLSLLLVHPKAWLNLAIMAKISEILSGGSEWQRIERYLISRVTDDGNAPDVPFEVALERSWSRTNRYFLRP